MVYVNQGASRSGQPFELREEEKRCFFFVENCQWQALSHHQLECCFAICSQCVQAEHHIITLRWMCERLFQAHLALILIAIPHTYYVWMYILHMLFRYAYTRIQRIESKRGKHEHSYNFICGFKAYIKLWMLLFENFVKKYMVLMLFTLSKCVACSSIQAH